MELEDLAGAIIGAAIEVDREHALILNFAKPTLEVKRAMPRPLPGFLGS